MSVEDISAQIVVKTRMSSWDDFYGYIRDIFYRFPYYYWRGQADASWGLESSLDRLLKKVEIPLLMDSKLSEYPEFLKDRLYRTVFKDHLEEFKKASRGRRNANSSKHDSMTENEWWALGQHYGLATPLLDWTKSPFVALYFAFENKEDCKTGERAVWAIGPFDEKNSEIMQDFEDRDDKAVDEIPPILEIIEPHQDDNARLVNQSGLFTKAPIRLTAESWVRKNYTVTDSPILHKIIIKDEERDKCLVMLNKMNINHVSLFPDLYGAGIYCNNVLSIKKYSDSFNM
jgi:hypothetical protein